MNTSLLEQELAPLNAQIEQTRKIYGELEEQLRLIEAEIETFSDDRQRFDALRDVCNAFEKLREMNAGELFWKGIPGGENAAEHLELVQSRVACFDEQIHGVLEKQAVLNSQIHRRSEELEYLYEEVRLSHDREERRKEEFVIERKISSVPYRIMVMPWTKEAESEKRFRRSVLVALLICFVLGAIIQLVKVPIPDRSVEKVEIPERLAKLVKQEPPKPVLPPKPVAQPAKEESQVPKEETIAKAEKKNPKSAESAKETRPMRKKTKVAAGGGGGGGTKAARKRAEGVGVLAFKNTWADLMEETPVAKLGTEARLSKESPRVAGQAVAQRSLVAVQAKGGVSGGIGNAGVSRNIGNGNIDRFGGSGIGQGGYGNGNGNGSGNGNGNGVGLGRVESTIADLAESSRPLSDGPGPGRTDEEIQIVFDRYKATLYRIYNKELRKDPTLRGKILLRICIETSGSVSMCKVESTDLASPELVAKIVARIKRFNFGPKDGVPKTTILYPIDFLPAG